MTSDAPKPTAGDLAHAVVKAGISSLPYVGSIAAELFQQVVQPPLDRRRVQWMEQMAERLRILEAKGVSLADLQNNEMFITAMLNASHAAMRTHQIEKLSALRNAVTNVALGQTPDETTQHLFLRFIDEFSEMHLRVLLFARAPRPSANILSGGLGAVLEDNIPSLRGHSSLCDQLWRDLRIRGLVDTESLRGTMSADSLRQSRTTSMGDELLRFIADPP